MSGGGEERVPFRLITGQTIPPGPNESLAAFDWLGRFAGHGWLAYGAGGAVVVSSAPRQQLGSSSRGRDGSAAGSEFFHQVLQLSSSDGNVDEEEATFSQEGPGEAVACVSWSSGPKSCGLLAAARGSSLYIFSPAPAGAPSSWSLSHAFDHPSSVTSIAWTKSGDGVFITGETEVAMWRLLATSDPASSFTLELVWEAGCWPCQGLGAVSYSYSDLVATADLTTRPQAVQGRSDQATGSNAKGMATLWQWVGSTQGQARPAEQGDAPLVPPGVDWGEDDVTWAGLAHPMAVVSLQWRTESCHPGEDGWNMWTDSNSSSPLRVHRPILLTCCQDGTVRLWMELDGGRGRLEQLKGMGSGEAGRAVQPPSFFVCAVVEASEVLGGVLGRDLSVSWAEDLIPGSASALYADPQEGAEAEQEPAVSQVAPCEWIVGVGPKGSVGLWAAHCLDDISPPRCPRTMLWQHSPGVLPEDHLAPAPLQSTLSGKPVAAPKEGRAGLQASIAKATARRALGNRATPPLSVDVFLVHPRGHLLWATLWPPVTGVGTGGKPWAKSVLSPTPNGALDTAPKPQLQAAATAKSLWGLSYETRHVTGSRAGIVQVAVHPAPGIGLAASVDSSRTVCIWAVPKAAAFSALAPPGTIRPGAEPAHWDAVHEIVWDVADAAASGAPEVAWAPVVMPDGSALLAVLVPGGVTLFIVQSLEQGAPPSSSPAGNAKASGGHRYICQPVCELPVPRSLDGVHILRSLRCAGDVSVPFPVFLEDDDVAGSRSFVVLAASALGDAVHSWVVAVAQQRGCATGAGTPVEDMVFSVELWRAGRGRAAENRGRVTRATVSAPPSQYRMILEVHALQALRTEGGTEVTSIAAVPSSSLGLMRPRTEARGAQEGGEWGDASPATEDAPAYVFATGGADGAVRLWALSAHLGDAKESKVRGSWECVGVLRAGDAPVKALSVGPSRVELATASLSRSQPSGTTVQVWSLAGEAGSSGRGGAPGFCETLSMQLEDQDAGGVLLAWNDFGHGQPLLTVAAGSSVHVLGLLRGHASEGGRGGTQQDAPCKWSQVGVYTASSRAPIHSAGWSPRGQLLVAQRHAMTLLQPWLVPATQVLGKRADGQAAAGGAAVGSGPGGAGNMSAVQSVPSLRSLAGPLSLSAEDLRRIASQDSLDGPKAQDQAAGSAGKGPILWGTYASHLGKLKEVQAAQRLGAAKRDLRAEALVRCADGQGRVRLLDALWCSNLPTPDFHPDSIVYLLWTGQIGIARACFRHLAHAVMRQGAPGTPQRSTSGSPRDLWVPCQQLSLKAHSMGPAQGPETGGAPQWTGRPMDSTSAGGQGLAGQLGGVPKVNPFSLVTVSSEDTDQGPDLTRENPFSASFNTFLQDGQPGEAATRVGTGGGSPIEGVEAATIEQALAGADAASPAPGLGWEEARRLQALFRVLQVHQSPQASAASGSALDAPARRFLLALQESDISQQLRDTEASQQEPAALGAPKLGGDDKPPVQALPSSAMAWALQSDSKEALLEAALSRTALPGQPQRDAGPPTWERLRAIGAVYWLSSVEQLKQLAEKIARQQFLVRRDPKDCALLYLALERRSVLQGLLKVSRDDRDRKLLEFLGRDFTVEANRAAALKNAYVLMSQHRAELAAAFFLLGEDVATAAAVCAKNLGDPQMGLLLCRVRDAAGGGAFMHALITKELLPNARDAKDPWLTAVLMWLTGEKMGALQHLAGAPPGAAAPASAASGEGDLGPMDPEVAEYCALVASRPGLQPVEDAAALATKAAVAAATAYNNIGLMLPALCHLKALLGAHALKQKLVGGLPQAPGRPQQPGAGQGPKPKEAPKPRAMSFMDFGDEDEDEEEAQAEGAGEKEGEGQGSGGSWVGSGAARAAYQGLAMRILLQRLCWRLPLLSSQVGDGAAGASGRGEAEQQQRAVTSVDGLGLADEAQAAAQILAPYSSQSTSDILEQMAAFASTLGFPLLPSTLCSLVAALPSEGTTSPAPLRTRQETSSFPGQAPERLALATWLPRVEATLGASTCEEVLLHLPPFLARLLLSRPPGGASWDLRRGGPLLRPGAPRAAPGGSQVSAGSSSLGPEVLYLVRLGGSLCDLASSLERAPGSRSTEEAWSVLQHQLEGEGAEEGGGGQGQNRERQLVSLVRLLAFFCFMAAAQVGRHAGALYWLMRDAVQASVGAAPPLPRTFAEAPGWFASLVGRAPDPVAGPGEGCKDAGASKGGPQPSSGGTASKGGPQPQPRSGGTAKGGAAQGQKGLAEVPAPAPFKLPEISATDTWRVLGPCLWALAAAYMEKQVRRAKGEPLAALGLVFEESSGVVRAVSASSLKNFQLHNLSAVSSSSATPSRTPPVSPPIPTGTPDSLSLHHSLSSSASAIQSPSSPRHVAGVPRLAQGPGAIGGGIAAVSAGRGGGVPSSSSPAGAPGARRKGWDSPGVEAAADSLRAALGALEEASTAQLADFTRALYAPTAAQPSRPSSSAPSASGLADWLVHGTPVVQPPSGTASPCSEPNGTAPVPQAGDWMAHDGSDSTLLSGAFGTSMFFYKAPGEQGASDGHAQGTPSRGIKASRSHKGSGQRGAPGRPKKQATRQVPVLASQGEECRSLWRLLVRWETVRDRLAEDGVELARLEKWLLRQAQRGEAHPAGAEAEEGGRGNGGANGMQGGGGENGPRGGRGAGQAGGGGGKAPSRSPGRGRGPQDAPGPESSEGKGTAPAAMQAGGDGSSASGSAPTSAEDRRDASGAVSSTKGPGASAAEEGTGSPLRKQEVEWTPQRAASVLSHYKAREALEVGNELLEAICVNAVMPDQAVVATNRRGLIFVDLFTEERYDSTVDSLWGELAWPQGGWAGSVATPPAAYLPGPKDGSGRGGVGVGGYGGIGAWGLGWEDLEDMREGYVDPPATADSVFCRALAAHPLRPLFLVGSDNTHVYLWEFGSPKALATYGVLPAAESPVPLVIPSVNAVRFDHYGHRFATAAADGTVSLWQLDVGGCSNVGPNETLQCFARSANDVAFVGPTSSVVAAVGFSPSQDNLVLWDSLAPPSSARVALVCHQGGTRSMCVVDMSKGGGPSISSSVIVTGGKGGDIAVHDFRYIASGGRRSLVQGKDAPGGQGDAGAPRGASPRSSRGSQGSAQGAPVTSPGPIGSDRTLWYIPKAHAGGVSKVVAIPGTSLFVSAGKDGDMRLWNIETCQLLYEWNKVHERTTFLNARGFGAMMQAAVTDVVPLVDGLLTCGADGIVKVFEHEEIVSEA